MFYVLGGYTDISLGDLSTHGFLMGFLFWSQAHGSHLLQEWFSAFIFEGDPPEMHAQNANFWALLGMTKQDSSGMGPWNLDVKLLPQLFLKQKFKACTILLKSVRLPACGWYFDNQVCLSMVLHKSIPAPRGKKKKSEHVRLISGRLFVCEGKSFI